MSQSGSGQPDTDLEGVELLFHQKGGSASLGAKMALSFNGVDLSCMNSITGSTCRAKCSNILHDKKIKKLIISGTSLGEKLERSAGNTKGGSITVLLTSFLTGLKSAV
jgi:hypothetical protein